MQIKNPLKLFREDPKSEASRWLARFDRGLREDEIESFHAWLSADPAHSDAIEKQKRNWRRLDTTAEWRPEHGSNPNPDLLAPSKRSLFNARSEAWWVLAGGSGLAAAVFLLVAVIRSDHSPLPSANFANVEEVEVIPQILQDGSTLFAKGGAEYKVAFSDSERRVYLESGEVYFGVAKDPGRPFVVDVRGMELTAVGTAFNVRLGPDSLELLVEEGTVAITEGGPPVLGSSERAETHAFQAQAILVAQQRAIVKFDEERFSPQVDSLSHSEVKRVIAWQNRRLHFDLKPLDEVVAEFNRLNDVQLILADTNLTSIEISGTMHSSNLQGFIRLLDVGFNIKAVENSDGTILLIDSTELNP